MCAPGAEPAATDQAIGVGDGEMAAFQLVKTYGDAFAPYMRAIAKPVAGSVMGTAVRCRSAQGASRSRR